LFSQQTLSLNQNNIYKLNFNPAASVDTNSKGHLSLLIGNIGVHATTNLMGHKDIYKNNVWDLSGILKSIKI